ncbi:Elongator complex protein 4 [Seminavis robusta]|uniref:Elongator complex protein 4 n=1 Tax=Seminavis robusta TaxID=568900 RepID=A0A9N8EXI7_9STRA|nr:Elongator complex protein 4 [Seminavis robusta]|eukprot:Sro1996_g310020.1 Elongator complex protein 4 (405) ;mRNA; r:2768-4088
MATTFKRRTTNKATAASAAKRTSLVGLPGTKPCFGGATQTSSGLRDLDAILGGGHPLGSAILVEEDRWTNSLASTIVRYWCAEAVAQNHHLLVPALEEESTNPFLSTDDDSATGNRSDIDNLRDSLPRNLHWDKQHAAQGDEHDVKAWEAPLTEATPNQEELDEFDEEEGGDMITELGSSKNINTQQTQQNQSSNIYCHSYDLSGRLSQQLERMGKPNLEQLFHTFPIQQSMDQPFPSRRIYQAILTRLQECRSNNRAVIRLLLHHLDPEILCKVLPLLLAQIRLQHVPVVVLVCLQPWKSTCTKAKTILRRHADVVLQTEGFSGRSHFPPPSELRHLQGLLLPRKVSTATAATAIGGGHYADITVGKRPNSNIFGIKRDRRKLHTVLLHIPPQEQIMDEGRPL